MWKTETGANGTMMWMVIGYQMEVSLMRRNTGRQDLYRYNLRWGSGDGAPMDCFWQENLTAESWDGAKREAIARTKRIVNSYLNELSQAMEVLNNA